MAASAVKLKPFATGADPVTISPGEGGTFTLAGLEPQSVGAPPILPKLVSGLSARRLAQIDRTRSGHVRTYAVETAKRPQVRVSWDGLTRAQRETLVTWLVGTLGVRLNSFNVEPDGAGEGIVRVLPVERFTETYVVRNGYTIDVLCEEVF